jgi:hypothetical protein
MRLLSLALLLLSGCAKPLSFQEYREPGGEFSVRVPVGWQMSERGPFSRKPVGEVWWVGELVAEHEGWPLGVMLFVRRLDRQHDPRATAYRKYDLAPTEALFGENPPAGKISVTKTELLGLPARLVTNDEYIDTTGDGLFHGPVKEYPSRVRVLVIQRPEAYYVLEYRAVRDRFEKYLPAFETMVASFKLKP